MINITYIVPYPELEDLVYKCFNAHPQKDIVNHNISVISADNLEKATFQCDVLISRGYTAKKLNMLMPNIPQIEVHITVYDIIKAVEECRTQFNPKKIGFVGAQSIINSVKNLLGLFNCEIELYNVPELIDIKKTLHRAVADGCDSIISGHFVNLYAKEMNINSIFIKTGEEAITQALNEAIRTVEVMRQERAKTEIFQTIAQCSPDGIIYIAFNGQIEAINKSALKMCTDQDVDLYKKNIKEAFPHMFSQFNEVIATGKEKNNVLHQVNKQVLSANYIPVKTNGTIAGVVINFQNITKIQQTEIQIRKKLSAKGLSTKYNFEDIIHKSKLMNETIETAKKFSRVSSNILLVGETGTGKELMAQSIHNLSNRNTGPFVAVNCAALPDNLLESELFGYVEGSFTGASKGGKIGLFELAHNGTLFLDEVSEIPLSFQSKLLRVLQEKEVRKIGDDKVVPIDVRIIAATNINLEKLVQKGEYRQDLLYRLDILKLYIPPLRKRKEDIYDLFMYYIGAFNNKFDTDIQKLTPDAMKMLKKYDFKGNVRELMNIAERICALNTTTIISKDVMQAALFPKDIDDNTETIETKQTIKNYQFQNEKELIEKALLDANLNKTQASKMLGINRSTLWRKLKKYNINIEGGN